MTGRAQELDVVFFTLLVYPLRSRGKDGHSAAAQIVSGWITPLVFRLQSRAYTIWINNCMLYPPPYIRSLPHSRFYCHFVFSVISDFSRVTGARPSLLCYVHTILASPDIGANAYCHLIGRDDENILSACIDQSDDTIYLLRYLHTKQQRWPCTRHTAKIRYHRKNKMTIKSWMWPTSNIGRRIEHAIVYSNIIRTRL